MAVTNANNAALAALIADARVGTFTHLITTKKGVVRGGKANPVTYGDDTVATTIVTGFKYIPLVERSKVEALALTDADKDAVVARGLTGWVRVWKKSAKVGDLKEIARGLGLDDSGTKADVVERLDEAVPGGMVERLVTREDVDEAYTTLLADLQRTLDGKTNPTNAHVYEPLVVDGEKVRGGRVYKGNPNGDDAALPGTVYIQGLAISSKVLVPAENGPVPASKSGPVSVAKKALRRLLSVSRYVSYALEPGSDFYLAAGGAAVAAADKNGLTVDAAKVAGIKALLAA